MQGITVDTSKRKIMRDVIQARISDVDEWLLQQQHANGSWLNSAWQTAKISMALVETGADPDHPKLKSAKDWLIGQAHELPNGISWEGWTWDTALVLRALKRLGEPVGSDLFKSALKWMKSEERKSISAPSPATYFGRCYTAQVIMAMLDAEDHDKENLNSFISTLQQQQDRDGGWINQFDTAQIVEALVAAQAPRTWQVKHNDVSYQGGLNNAVEWFEATQSQFGNWDGLTWPTAWTLRAYVLAAERPDPTIVTLALGWLLEQSSATNPSWFGEAERSASVIITLQRVLNRFAPGNNWVDLDISQTQFYFAFERYSQGRERALISRTLDKETLAEKAATLEQQLHEATKDRAELENETRKLKDDLVLRQNELLTGHGSINQLRTQLSELEEEKTRLSEERDKYRKQRQRILFLLILGGASIFIIIAVVGYALSYEAASYILGLIGVFLAVLPFVPRVYKYIAGQ